ncbi:ATP-binding protein [Microlunatus sp. GCM10028923]|uniref:ATP-binding protein n=1 Tax=Microlunatus sp. GCM10028923 TaxID=3273400 RepID=UPI00360EA494
MITTWHGFRFHRLISVPSPGDGDQEYGMAEPGRSAPLAAPLIGSHRDLLASGAPEPSLIMIWVRAPGRSRLRILVGGRPHFPPAVAAADGPAPVLFPPGAKAIGATDQEVAELTGAFPSWVPCLARPDALWAPDTGPQPNSARRGSFDRHVAHLDVPFAWMIMAEPVPGAEVEAELQALTREILPLSRAEVGEANRVELERRRARHRELSRARRAGAWRVQVSVGGVTPTGATTVAGLLCAASELDGLPYLLEPAGPAAPVGAAGPSFTCGPELLAALLRPPERELPGLRMTEPHTFDVTPEPVGETIRLGTVLDQARSAAGDMAIGEHTLNRHLFVCGATGGGKSQTIRHLLTEATRSGIPWLVIEPAKAEYARMAQRLTGLGSAVTVIRPGDPRVPPAGMNPFEPAPGFSLQSHVDLLRASFLAAFEAQEPFPQILAAALTRCYEELGWDLTLGEPAHPGRRLRYPTLGDLQRVAAAVVTEIGYGKDIADNVRGFIDVRLGSLRLGTTGRFLEGGHPLDFAELYRRNVVLEIEDVGDDADKAFLIAVILIRLSEHLRVAARDGTRPGLAHLTVIEEAHRLLRAAPVGQTGAAAHAVELFASLLAEVRSYGEGLIIAEQIPSKLTADVIKNTGQDRSSTAGPGRPGQRRSHDEHRRRAFPPAGLAAARRGRRVRRRNGSPDPDPGSGRHRGREIPAATRRADHGGDRAPQPDLRHRMPRRAVHAATTPNGRQPAGHRTVARDLGRAGRGRPSHRTAAATSPPAGARHGPSNAGLFAGAGGRRGGGTSIGRPGTRNRRRPARRPRHGRPAAGAGGRLRRLWARRT